MRDDKFSFTMPVRNAGPQELTMALQFAPLATRRPGRRGSGGAAQPANYALSTGFDADERDRDADRRQRQRLDDPHGDRADLGPAAVGRDPRQHRGAVVRQLPALHGPVVLRRSQRQRRRAAETAAYNQLLQRRFLPFTDTDAYRVLKAATEAFVIVNCGVFTGEPGFDGDPGVLADLRGYLDRRDLPRPGREPVSSKGSRACASCRIWRSSGGSCPTSPINDAIRGADLDADLCDGFVREKLRNPCLLELIWSYWHEEGMLVQTMNAITRRFQNVRGRRPAGSAGQHRSQPAASAEQPALGLHPGRAAPAHRGAAQRRVPPPLRTAPRRAARCRAYEPADTRSKFIEAFHHLLRLCTVFYKQDDDTTVKADAFGVLNALKEVHLILSQGAHSQFGDLPPTARIEMLMQQWLLSRPEFREFLPTRVMVAYPEPWMDRVDAMKTVQGWTDTSVMHFHNLAVFGEQILLSIRYGAWSVVFEPTQAFNFARFWRPQVQGYIHAYRAATGVELGAEIVDSRVDATLPSVLLQKRLATSSGATSRRSAVGGRRSGKPVLLDSTDSPTADR